MTLLLTNTGLYKTEDSGDSGEQTWTDITRKQDMRVIIEIEIDAEHINTLFADHTPDQFKRIAALKLNQSEVPVYRFLSFRSPEK